LTRSAYALNLESMIRYGIDKFVGSWVSASGNLLRIKKVRKDLASVDFYDRKGAPVQRHYMGGAPSTSMAAYYDDYFGNFEVELWEEKRFILDLSHEYDYELDPKRREALVPALSWNTGDRSLDEWRSAFGPLDHFVRRKEPAASNNNTPTKSFE
jgi:hypothetical protein